MCASSALSRSMRPCGRPGRCHVGACPASGPRVLTTTEDRICRSRWMVAAWTRAAWAPSASAGPRGRRVKWQDELSCCRASRRSLKRSVRSAGSADGGGGTVNSSRLLSSSCSRCLAIAVSIRCWICGPPSALGRGGVSRGRRPQGRRQRPLAPRRRWRSAARCGRPAAPSGGRRERGPAPRPCPVALWSDATAGTRSERRRGDATQAPVRGVDAPARPRPATARPFAASRCRPTRRWRRARRPLRPAGSAARTTTLTSIVTGQILGLYTCHGKSSKAYRVQERGDVRPEGLGRRHRRPARCPPLPHRPFCWSARSETYPPSVSCHAPCRSTGRSLRHSQLQTAVVAAALVRPGNRSSRSSQPPRSNDVIATDTT